MAAARNSLVITTAAVADTCVLRVYGALDATTYFRLRDAILKAALDEPRAVIVDVTRLAVVVRGDWTVFTDSSKRAAGWPLGVMMVLVCNSVEGQKALRRNGLDRYFPVYWSVAAAVGALTDDDEHPYRRRARAELSGARSGSRQCWELVDRWLTAWSKTDYLMVVSLVAAELVENALAHSSDPVSLQLEADTTTVTVAVHDTSPAAAMRPETAAGDAASGLDLVDTHCRAWGNVLDTAGKTVWATIGPENSL